MRTCLFILVNLNILMMLVYIFNDIIYIIFINSIINQCTLHRPELSMYSYISEWVQIRGHVTLVHYYQERL